MSDAQSLSMRRRVLEELDEIERSAPGTTVTWSPSDDDDNYDVRVREATYLLETGAIKGFIGGGNWITARITAFGRDHLDTLRNMAMATVAKLLVPVPQELPGEWKELARGIAAKHNFNGEPHLTNEGILLVLTSYADAREVEDEVPRIRAELEHALSQPSRVKAHSSTSNVFVNNGQAGAIGPNAVASGNTFQQQINVQPLTGDEQKRVVEQLDRLMAALRTDASEPDQFTALAEVRRAQLAAQNGDRSTLMGALKKAGKWVYDVAEKIGVEVVASIIKSQM